MKKSLGANLALVLITLGWGMCFFGLASQLGDPNPHVPRAVIEAQQRTLWAVFFVGACFAFVSIWLAGYAYTGAKVRSITALSLGVVPLLGLGVWIVSDV